MDRFAKEVTAQCISYVVSPTGNTAKKKEKKGYIYLFHELFVFKLRNTKLVLRSKTHKHIGKNLVQKEILKCESWMIKEICLPLPHFYNNYSIH